MTDPSETAFQELSKIESRDETQAGGTEEGLSPEVRQRMEEGRERVQEATDNLKMEQGASEALGESMPGDVAGEAIEAELEENERQSSEAGLSPEVQRRMAEGRARADAIGGDLAAAQNEAAGLGEEMPGDVAGEGLGGTTGEEDRAAAARAADSQRPS